MAIRVADMSVDDLRILIQEVVTQTLEELFHDPDEGLELREDFKEALQHSLSAVQASSESLSAESMATQLRLKWKMGI